MDGAAEPTDEGETGGTGDTGTAAPTAVEDAQQTTAAPSQAAQARNAGFNADKDGNAPTFYPTDFMF